MRFSIRDMLWLTALVAMGISWWLDARYRDWTIKSAQLRKDYYNLMSDLARSESQKANEARLKYERLTAELQRQHEKADKERAGRVPAPSLETP